MMMLALMRRICIVLLLSLYSSAFLARGMVPGELPHACQGSSGNMELSDGSSVTNAIAESPDGSLALKVPLLCSSYSCRAALALAASSGPPAEGLALAQHLLQCATSDVPGVYTMLDFTVEGFPAATNASWWTWVSAALSSIGVASAPGLSTWFPQAPGTKFYMTLAGGGQSSAPPAPSKVSGSDLGAALRGEIALQTAMPWVQAVQIVDFQYSTLSVPEPQESESHVELRWMETLCAVAVVYAILSVVAYHLAIPWLQPLLLCWPQLCDGGGCLVYRVMCAPCVLSYNAMRIFGGACCCSYLAKLSRLPWCKGCCWKEFVDSDFPPNDKSIGKVKGDTASGIAGGGAVAWAKATAIAGNNARDGAHLFEGEIEPADVLQGALGDCWLMAALACIAERPEVLQQAIVTKHIDPRGKYHFRLFNQIRDTPGTKWVDIIVDENIPVEPNTLTPKFARSHTGEMWVLLLEKAFAKMYGSYAQLDGGQMHWALSAITGNPSVQFFKDGQGKPWKCGEHSLEDDQFFSFLRHVRRNGAFVCCAMIAQANKMGLIDGHAYSIIQVQKVHESPLSQVIYRFVQIRNPHGETEWTGAWSDKSTAWDRFPHIRQQLCGSASRVEDGTFWMQWEDFVQFWKMVDIVDCGTNIRMVATPVHQNPLLASLEGCWEYWCCCIGCKTLYCSRKAATTFQGLALDMDARCGWDEAGLTCSYCDGSSGSFDTYRAGHDDHDEEKGLMAGEEKHFSCWGSGDKRQVSRSRHG
eukprot:TRINITY_DN10073_c0_g1_i1.p1 TRINITY_DN10073_c0_g1~~TRINITY_DN10073_c0_g1_i1.p1  ORF type:complete len:755 (+),score=103.33 TRINITY_DN10073_c0_g1_i1:109-2373(+)